MSLVPLGIGLLMPSNSLMSGMADVLFDLSMWPLFVFPSFVARLWLFSALFDSAVVASAFSMGCPWLSAILLNSFIVYATLLSTRAIERVIRMIRNKRGRGRDLSQEGIPSAV